MVAVSCLALLLQRLKPAIEQDVELLSDAGRDRMFNAASSIFYRLPKMIASQQEDGEPQAFRLVRSSGIISGSSACAKLLYMKGGMLLADQEARALVACHCVWP